MKKRQLLLMGILLISIFACLYGCVFTPKLPTLNPTSLTSDQRKTLASLEKLDNYPLYVMTYYGDYSALLLELKKKYHKILRLPKPSQCTTFTALNKRSAAILGRNNDYWEEPVLLLFTHPPTGYSSVSIVSIGGSFGFDRGEKTPFKSAEAQTRLLYAPFSLFDGMNEWGLTIGGMAVLDSKTSSNPNKKTMFDTEARRYLLDHAKNVDEAIAILSKFNISFPNFTPPTHYLIADPSGKSAIIEWNDGNMVILRNERPWQVATNHLISNSQELIKKHIADYQATNKLSKDINGRSYWRYITAHRTLQEMDGNLSPVDAMRLLQTTSLIESDEIWFKEILYPTQWSVVYNMKTGEINLAIGRNYSHILKFKLSIKNDQG